MGDPCGVGPEIIAKTFLEPAMSHNRLLVIGSPEWMKKAVAAIPGCSLSVRRVASIDECRFSPTEIECFAPFEYDMSLMKQGKVCPEAGRCAAKWVIEAVLLANANKIDGIVTAPLNKEAMHKGGFKYGGHTEILAEYAKADTSRLCLASESLNVVHATCHIPFDEISTVLAKPGQIMETIELAHHFMSVEQGITNPRIVLAGLNPHCEPIFGDQETRIIQPVIDQAIRKGMNVYPTPIPPDTVFMRAINKEFDIVIAMYHDQGHIPAKISGFGDTVNVTLGLPIVRTSVDHGTAFDIAGKGIASHSNMLSALDLGARMACGRRAAQAVKSRL